MKFCYQLIITITTQFRVFLVAVKKSHLSARVSVLSNYLGMTRTLLLHCPISAEIIRTVDSQSDLRILL